MGNTLQVRVLVLGLDNSGKTSIVHALETGQPLMNAQSTVGFTVKEINKKSCQLSVWDVAGKENLRGLWKHYYEKTQAIVWVVDSSDEKRLEESKQCLQNVISEPHLKDACLLVMANKQDVSGALSAEQVSQKLELEKIARNHPWHVQASSATPAIAGLDEGFDWVAKSMKEILKKKKKDEKH